MLNREVKPAPASGKILLSAGLIVISGAYTAWLHIGQFAGTRPAPPLAVLPPHPVAARKPVPQTAIAAPVTAAPQIATAAAPAVQTLAAQNPTAQKPAVPAPAAMALPPGTAVTPAAPTGTRVAAEPYEAAPAASAMPSTVYTAASTGAVPTAIHNWHYADGDWTGQVADTAYGPVQVKIGIHNGVMNEIHWLMYPDHRDESIQINTTAMPLLSSEAIQSQSADVDKTTQATLTTEGFQSSLYTALEQAKRP
jgi:uncharacterized protein with FMN-binding domain